MRNIFALCITAVGLLASYGCDDKTPQSDDAGATAGQPLSAGGIAGSSIGGEEEEIAGSEVNGGSVETGGDGLSGSEGGGGSGGEVSSGEEVDPCMAIEDRCDGTFEQPPAMNEHVGVYVDEAHMLVIFGGNTSVPENCGFPAYTGETQTWLYYDRPLMEGCGPWVKIEEGPPGRARHSADAGDGGVWIFGGRVRAGSSGPYTLFNDLWRFDPETRAWTEVPSMNTGPSPRYNASLTYDPARRALWVFGGNIATSALTPNAVHDLWRFDIDEARWTEIETPSYVLDRMWHQAIFDIARDRLVIFGGADETAFFDAAVYFNDLLFYNPEQDTWGEASPELRPDGRFWSQLVYRPEGDQYLLFGGHDDQQLGNRNDSWSFDPNGGGWTALTGEDTFNKPANGFCDFPPDFTIVDRSLPERRNAHSLSWSTTCDRGYLFGGKTDCGAINDVWEYHPEEGWISKELATEGEVCHRWRANPDNCANMCF